MKTYFKKTQLIEGANTQENALNGDDAKLRELIQNADKSGAAELAIVSTRTIEVDDDLADRCREPRCENYGLSRSCPPHVSGPSRFKKKLEEFKQAIFFRIDVPSEVLYSSERRELFQLLHEIAGIEKSAIGMGFSGAEAYAGGSCKKIFCYDHAECLRLLRKENAGILTMQDLLCLDSGLMWQSSLKRPGGLWAPPLMAVLHQQKKWQVFAAWYWSANRS